jgi:prephenate dehydrogenase
LQAAVQDFVSSREQAIQFVRSNRDDLRSKITSHPLFGTVNCYEMLLLLAAHSQRHVKQIEEIKAAIPSTTNT